MKNIGIDARLYFQTGVGVYIRNLLHYLQKIASDDITFFIYVMKSDSARITFTRKNFIKREVTAKWHSFGEQTTFLRILNKDKLDLMHFTYFSYPVRYKRPFIATIHDVTPLQFKTGKASTKNRVWYEIKHQAFKYVLKNQVKNAKAIITPTKTVKKQLVEIFGKSLESKIQPLYEGIDYDLANCKENTSLANKFSDKFFVYIGNFYPHKNVEQLVQSFSKTTRAEKLVLVGPASYFSEQLKKIVQQLRQEHRILFYHNATIEDLVFFYNHAEALINPSLSEGFGLPLIESLHFDLPIIASHIEVFKELLDDHYCAFDPKSTESIQKAIQSFDKQDCKIVYQDLKKRYSFEKMSEETLKVYKMILEN